MVANDSVRRSFFRGDSLSGRGSYRIESMTLSPYRRYRYIILAILVGLLICIESYAAEPDNGRTIDGETIRQMANDHASSAFEEFRALLNFPNDANRPADILKLVEYLDSAFSRRGFSTQLIKTSGSPLLFAEMDNKRDDATVLIYLQADGQPVEPSAWDQENPFEAVLKAQDKNGDWQTIAWESLAENPNPDWRVFARSAADSKGPIVQFLSAIDVLNHASHQYDFNIKVIVDTEEELGSPNLADAVNKNRKLLAADMLIIFDGPPHASNEPTLVFGARGITTVTLTTHGPRVPQHSGHYGNYVRNPVFDLAEILNSLKMPDGRVAIDGYYDGIRLRDDEKEFLDEVPDDPDTLRQQFGVASFESIGATLQEAIQYPSLNVRGIEAAWVGKDARTVIPATATAEIDIRTVKESDPRRLLRLFREHVKGLGFYVVNREPTDVERQTHVKIVTFTSKISYGAFRSDVNSLPGRLARAGMVSLYDNDPILIRTYGGSIPISPFVEALSIPAVVVPTVNIDNNQHSPNENIRIGNFTEGVAIMIAVLRQDVPSQQQ